MSSASTANSRLPGKVEEVSSHPPRTALVLSAGGAFGAYQAGAWAALAPDFQPDLFVGTSIGSIHAWLLSGGLSPAQLHDIWLDPSSSLPLKPRLPRSWRDGIFDHSPLEHRLRHLHQLVEPRHPVAIVAVTWKGLHSHLFHDRQITWRHLAASCAVPFVLPQPRLDGVTYMDGGILESVNIWAALELGATRIVAINCWKPRAPWWLDWPVGWIAAQKRKNGERHVRHADPADVRIEIIEPAGTLGTFKQSLFWNRENVESWYQLGFDDASRKKHSLCDMF